jgi:hypothetical protein
MEMIWHHHPSVEGYMGTAAGHLYPLFGDDRPKVGEDHFPLSNFAEPADPFVGTDRHDVDSALAIIPPG